MKDISLHLMDIAQNSVSAGATLIQISFDCRDGFLIFRLTDNGRGMDEELLKTVTDPFTTTRTTREVGMGIPLLKLSAEITGGSFEIKSQKDLFAVELDGALKRLQIVEQQYKDELDAQGFVSEETIKKKDDLTKFIQDTTQKQNDFTVESGIESAKKQIETEEEKEQKVKQLREDRVNFASQLEDKLYSFTNFLIDNQQKNLDNQLKKGLISQKEYDKKTAELKRKQAIADKANAAFKIGIGIAEAITVALSGGPIIGVVLAGIAAALGAAQLAVVLATPIPQFKKGGLTDKIFKGSGYVTGKSHDNGGVNANLEGNEFVMQQTAVNKYGKDVFEKLNKGILNPDIFAVPTVNYGKIFMYSSAEKRD